MTEPAIQPTPGNIEAALVRLEGKLDRVIDNQTRQADDMKVIRERVHEHANMITGLTVLNIPEKLADLREAKEDHARRLDACESDRDQRKGAMTVMRALWALIGFMGAGGVFAIAKLAFHS